MGTGALDDIDIPQGMSKLGVLGFGFLGGLRHVVGALHRAQDDHLRLRLRPAAETVCDGTGSGAWRQYLYMLTILKKVQINHCLILTQVR